jgi:glucose dehydrogenase
MTFARWIGVGVVLISGAALAAQQGARSGSWTSYSGDPGATKYAALDQIDKSNVSRLPCGLAAPVG